MGLDETSESEALADILISTLWNSEQRLQLSHAHTSELKKLLANIWCYFKPLNLYDLLNCNRKLTLAFAWLSPGHSPKFNSKGFWGILFLAFYPLNISKIKSKVADVDIKWINLYSATQFFGQFFSKTSLMGHTSLLVFFVLL